MLEGLEARGAEGPPGAYPGRYRVFLGMGQTLPGTPELFLGAFLLLGKTHRFPGTLKQFLGISIAPVRVGSWRDEHKLCGDGISNVARGWLRVEWAADLN